MCFIYIYNKNYCKIYIQLFHLKKSLSHNKQKNRNLYCNLYTNKHNVYPNNIFFIYLTSVVRPQTNTYIHTQSNETHKDANFVSIYSNKPTLNYLYYDELFLLYTDFILLYAINILYIYNTKRREVRVVCNIVIYLFFQTCSCKRLHNSVDIRWW